MIEEDEAKRKHRLIKIVLGFSALICLLAGFILYTFQGPLGFDQETAQLMALVFMGTAVIDLLFMRFWDRIVKLGNK